MLNLILRPIPLHAETRTGLAQSHLIRPVEMEGWSIALVRRSQRVSEAGRTRTPVPRGSTVQNRVREVKKRSSVHN
jgi:hypothetical protein